MNLRSLWHGDYASGMTGFSILTNFWQHNHIILKQQTNDPSTNVYNAT
ncbi:hypothetical protein [Synechocystis sp. PCC 7509]|nr:hypothetical protein [Synechocystis sp. PCC 7509]